MSLAITDIATRNDIPTSQPSIRAVPAEPEARGFVLYIGLGDDAQEADGIDLATLVRELREHTARVAPSAQTHAAVALAPAGAGGRDIDVVRRALHDPALRSAVEADQEQAEEGVEIDFARNRVSIDGNAVALTYKEFELLQSIVLRTGRAVAREELIDLVWPASDAEDRPSARTIDVHIRRLRAKLGGYADIIRTVRGEGYRFDGHPDVAVRTGLHRSPDVF